ncbi:hypothetical protein EON65_03790 [archaeon]|nr:MAG: hypothetical protein EON65_03790 [archaeon]
MEGDEENSSNHKSDHEESRSKDTKRLKKEALAYRESLEKRGVLYISRVPPFMKPNKLRTLLEPYGEITRLFLAEEGSLSNTLPTACFLLLYFYTIYVCVSS